MGGISFLNPAFFWLLLLIPAIVAWRFIKKGRNRAVLNVSSVQGFKASPSLRMRLYPALFWMRIAAMVFMIIALARPRTMDPDSRSRKLEGIDIVMAIDVSGSMLARDLKPDRLTALKEVAADFTDARRNDRIGLVLYAAESYTRTPITSDKALLKEAIRSIRFDNTILKDGTAIGMGLATAVNRIKDSKAKSKVIILLTDGVNNAGTIEPLTAAGLAKEFNIKVYTIGIGTNGNAEFPYALGPDGKLRYQMQPVKIDEEILKGIAKQTGGQYFRATDNSSLKSIYADINKLETTELDDIRYYSYTEWFRPFVFLALGLLLLEALARKTLYRSFI
ncbi:VWA domain-containing protein [Flavobacterium sp. J372]|uniref:vWA domain-containing protein n=1 Tax=Flavobacterium sp. J372 TaxID=2898436 RepID=UPI002151CEBA|nr:VWA domain-containing protein [Flavobacterium sp. J372]MCR5861084.1 VWA domain-containing protein [Flavobacterium sp. J372]